VHRTGREGHGKQDPALLLETVNGCHQPSWLVASGHDCHLLYESTLVESTLLRPRHAIVAEA